MKIKLFSKSNVKRYFSILGTCAILTNSIYSMNTLRCSYSYYNISSNYTLKFLYFLDNSAFNLFSKNDLVKGNILNRLFEENKLDTNMLQKSYNMLRYYKDMELAIRDRLFVSKDIVSELIRYISNYPYDGTFWSVCEIFQLTVECLVRTGREYLIGLNNMHFNFENFKENGTTMTFTRFKECMIARLERLLETM